MRGETSPSYEEPSSQVAKKYGCWQAFQLCEELLIGGNEGCLEEMGKGDKRSIIEGNFMFPGEPEGLFGEKKVNGMYLKGKSKAFP